MDLYGILALVIDWSAAFDVVFDVVIVALAALVSSAIVAAAKKFGADLDQKAVAEKVRNVLNWAEEKARVSEKLGEKMPSEEKLEQAIQKLVEKIPGISKAEADYLIHAYLKENGYGKTFRDFYTDVVREATDGDDDAPVASP